MNGSYVYFLLLRYRVAVLRTHSATFRVIKTSALSCRPNSAVACRSLNGKDGNRAEFNDFDPGSLPGSSVAK